MLGVASDHNRCPPMKWQTNAESHILHCNWLLLITSETGVPLCVGVCQAWDWCTSLTVVKATPRRSGSEIMPCVASGLATTQHQTNQTSLGWINRKLWLLLWMFTGGSTEDVWRLQVKYSGSGCLHLWPIDAIGQQNEWSIIYLDADYSHLIEEEPYHWLKGWLYTLTLPS